jgi:hypothetical protein
MTHHQREDHFRMREVSLNYTLPSSLIGGMGVSRAAFTVSGRNLWTPYVHDSFTDLDPEARPLAQRGVGLAPEPAAPPGQRRGPRSE